MIIVGGRFVLLIKYLSVSVSSYLNLNSEYSVSKHKFSIKEDFWSDAY